jgi:hypothetical protein
VDFESLSPQVIARTPRAEALEARSPKPDTKKFKTHNLISQVVGFLYYLSNLLLLPLLNANDALWSPFLDFEREIRTESGVTIPRNCDEPLAGIYVCVSL